MASDVLLLGITTEYILYKDSLISSVASPYLHPGTLLTSGEWANGWNFVVSVPIWIFHSNDWTRSRQFRRLWMCKSRPDPVIIFVRATRVLQNLVHGLINVCEMGPFRHIWKADACIIYYVTLMRVDWRDCTRILHNGNPFLIIVIWTVMSPKTKTKRKTKPFAWFMR